MSRLTVRQRKQIAAALYHAKRAAVYLEQPSVAVARKGGPATTTAHYTRADGAVLYEVEKGYGSDLCGLSDCVRGLELLLEVTP